MCAACATVMPVHCCARRCGSSWMSASLTGSSRRWAEIRWRCSSCRGLTATQLAGGFGLPEAQAMSGRIQESFVRRVSAVSDDARRLLLLAAAEPIGDPLLLLRASELLGIAFSAVDAETDGLLALSPRVPFPHP